MKRLVSIIGFLPLALFFIMSLISIIYSFPILLENFNNPDINESLFVANTSVLMLAVFTGLTYFLFEKFINEKLKRFVLVFPFYFTTGLGFFFLIKSILWGLRVSGTPYEESMELEVIKQNAILACGSLSFVYFFLSGLYFFLIPDNIWNKE